MDAVLCRLRSIRQSIKHVNTWFADEEQKILKSLLDISTHLNTIKVCNEGTLKSLWDGLLIILSDIESMLYVPVVSHLITQLEIEGQEVNYDNELRAIHEESVCSFQDSKVKERLTKASPLGVCLDESIDGITDDYWVKRRDRINDFLGNTSLRFDKNCLKRSKQKSLSWDPCIVETDIELSNGELKVLQLPRSSEKRAQSGKYSQKFIDTFWGLTEDKWKGKDKKWKTGEIICVLNCKSELKKLHEFLKEKRQVRSFYIQRKPRGLAGCKGTWLTPPYSPPFVVKYGCPGKPSSK